jgi:hypothetical protein
MLKHILNNARTGNKLFTVYCLLPANMAATEPANFHQPQVQNIYGCVEARTREEIREPDSGLYAEKYIPKIRVIISMCKSVYS